MTDDEIDRAEMFLSALRWASPKIEGTQIDRPDLGSLWFGPFLIGDYWDDPDAGAWCASISGNGRPLVTWYETETEAKDALFAEARRLIFAFLEAKL
jgi:hypothetical protein